MGFFGIAHILYIRGLGLRPLGNIKRDLPVFGALWVFSVIYIGKDIDDLFLRVMTTCYGTVVLIMVWRAYVRFLTFRNTASLAALVGAAIFTISDDAIAINKWKSAFPGASTFIMLTYYSGQFGLAYSAIM